MTVEKDDDIAKKNKLSRRTFLKGAAAGGVIAAVAVGGAAELIIPSQPSSGTTTKTVTVTSPGGTTTVTTGTQVTPTAVSTVTLMVNGKVYTLNLDNRWTLANTLRYKLNLIGTKVGCDHGECGACAVLVNGTPMLSCMMLAVESQGKSITTIEGMGGPENLSPVQAALCDNDGIQCGACTPGVVIVATAFLKANPSPTQAALANALAGNLCKCGNWPHVFAGLMTVKGV
jgi:aerobic-type carbon monoxide dehydrogenase small subunit (CoxS/CutS family)